MLSLSAAPRELLSHWWDPDRVTAWLEQAERLGPIAWPTREQGAEQVAALEASAAAPAEPLVLSGDCDAAIVSRGWWPIERLDAAGSPYWLLLPPDRAALPPRGQAVPLLAGHGGRQVGTASCFCWGGGPERLACWIHWARFTGREQRAARQGWGFSLGAVLERQRELPGRLVLADLWQLREVSLTDRPGAPGTGLIHPRS